MKHIIYLFNIIYVLLLASCGPVSQRNNITIDLVNHKQLPVEEILLSDISESIQMIHLESNDSALVSILMDIKLEANKIYLRALNGVFVFDLNGKFLNMVGAKGRGPKEYVNLNNLFPENDMVWLLDNSGKKALKFTDSGRFIESFELEQQWWTTFCYSSGDSFIGFVPDNGQPNTDVMLAFFNTTEMIDSILYRKPIQEANIAWSFIHEASFIHHGSQIKFKHVFNDTIYTIKDYKLIPDIVINLGTRKANENARAIAVNSDPTTHDIFEGMDVVLLQGENERYIYLEVVDTPIFYDKKELKVHKWAFILPEDERIDQEKAKKFVPKYIDKNGYLIGETAPANEEDNPVIVLAKLK